MKKILFAIIICNPFQMMLHAQKASLGIVAGTAFTNYKVKFGSLSMGGKSRTGITAGLVADIPAGKQFSIQPALHFIQYGTTFESSGEGETEKSQLKVNCIELPLNFLANIPTAKGGFFIGAGPSFTMALNGKSKQTSSTSGELEESLKFGSGEEDNMKSLNIGGNILGGYRFNTGVFISLNYNIGFSNLLPKPTDGESTKSHYFGVRIGYFFNKNPK